MTDTSLLYLFSSNIRPLYAQDILDVLAAPVGGLYQFRYERRWIDPVGRERWLDLPKGTPVLVHFSLQQQARYHDAVFFPIRRGEVRRTFGEGETLFVEFVLGDLVSLPEWPKTEEGRPNLSSEPTVYARYLGAKNAPHPYEFSAGLGPNILDEDGPLDSTSDQVTLFERITKYLQSTDSFRDSRFFRFLRLAPRGKDKHLVPSGDGVFELEGGKTYTLELFHHQPVEVTREDSFTISVDGGIIRVIGRAGFDIGSRYDRIPIPLHAVQSDKYEARETVLVIEPAPSVKGPQLRLHLRVSPPSKKLLFGSLFSTLALAGLGSASLLPFSTGVKVLAIVGSVLTIAILSFFGLFVNSLAGFKLSGLGTTSSDVEDSTASTGEAQPRHP